VYTPRPFQRTDVAALLDFVAAHPFGLLVAAGEGGAPQAAHLPFHVAREEGPCGTLHCHLARANPLWRLAEAGRPLLAVFSGPHGYVSPRWYTTPPASSVPTWNYAAVHAHGRCEVVHAPERLLPLVDALSRRFEPAELPEGAAPWSTQGLDARVREGLLGGIVGLALRVERLEGTFKLSQNRAPADRAGVVRGLRALGDAEAGALAALMEREEG
jgi:transcriptional regulator